MVTFHHASGLPKGERGRPATLGTARAPASPKPRTRWRVSVFAHLTLPRGDLLARKRTTGEWGFPGGRNSANESLEETLLRETWEETGLLVQDPQILLFAEDAYRRQLMFLYKVSLRTTRIFADPPSDTEEVDAVGLFPLHEFPERLTRPTRWLLAHHFTATHATIRSAPIPPTLL